MTSNQPPVTAELDVAWQERCFRSRDGLSLFYRDYAGPGDRSPLLGLHGLTRNSREFEAFAARHAGQFRVIAMDFRGRGKSDRDPRPENYLPTTYAADVIELLDHLEIERALFVGTSLGGLVTMIVAATNLHRIAGAILNDVGPALDEAGLERIQTYVGKPKRFGSWREAADYVAAINMQLPASHGPDDWLRLTRRLCREDADGIVFDYDMAIAEPFNQSGPAPEVDLWPLYRALGQVPLLIVRGERSDLLSAETAEAMREAASDVDVVTVPGVGHAPELTEPEAAAAIDEFLRRF